jgi:hypothetical protein
VFVDGFYAFLEGASGHRLKVSLKFMHLPSKHLTGTLSLRTTALLHCIYFSLWLYICSSRAPYHLFTGAIFLFMGTSKAVVITDRVGTGLPKLLQG